MLKLPGVYAPGGPSKRASSSRYIGATCGKRRLRRRDPAVHFDRPASHTCLSEPVENPRAASPPKLAPQIRIAGESLERRREGRRVAFRHDGPAVPDNLGNLATVRSDHG